MRFFEPLKFRDKKYTRSVIQSGRLIRVHRMHGYGEIAEANRMLPSEPVKAGWIFN